MNIENKKAIILLSGGLDSTTTLFWAINKGYECHAIIFDYNQRHKKEVIVAQNIAKLCNIDYKIVKFNIPWGGSDLIEKNKELPHNRKNFKKIPTTYVPARNIIFLSIATSFAEVIGADTIFIGANIVDYSGYPDCRKNFLDSMQMTINFGTKIGVEKNNLKIIAPLLELSKKDIVLLGKKLKVPFEKTWSCYEGGDKPCGKCDSCILREKGFREAKIFEGGE